jgi:hypothetical protein
MARRLACLGLLSGLALLAGCGATPQTTFAVPPANAATQTQGSAPAPVEASATPSGGGGEIDALLHDLRIAKERVDRELARKEQLAVAREQELDRAAADAAPSSPPATGGSGSRARPERKSAPGPAPAPEKKREQAHDERAEAESSSDSVGSPCDTACRALASMERSAARICSLTSMGDARCVSAREMVAASRERVESSGCWCRSFGPRGSER